MIILAVVLFLTLPEPWNVVGVLGALAFEVVEITLLVKISRRWRVRTGAEGLVGARGEVLSACRPEGQVRVHGELWRARAERPVEEGERVCVLAVDGLTLRVEPAGQRVRADRAG